MPTLEDLNNELRQMGVLPSEVNLSRKDFGKIMERGSDLAENDDGDDD